MSNNNITFREGNLNDISQNLNNENIEESNNIDINNSVVENNNINNLDYNYKSQYHLLNETLNLDIDLEMKRISKD